MGTRADAFSGQLYIVSRGPTTWKLITPLTWTGTKGDTFTVPKYFVTDFATVPRVLVWKTLPYGPYTRAAVLHDWLLTELADWTIQQRHFTELRNTVGVQPPANSRDCDGIFRRVMEDLGVSWLTRWQMWAAVRLASLFNWRRAYGRQFYKDAPKVFGLLLISAPFVLPGLIGVSISLALSLPFARRGRG